MAKQTVLTALAARMNFRVSAAAIAPNTNSYANFAINQLAALVWCYGGCQLMSSELCCEQLWLATKVAVIEPAVNPAFGFLDGVGTGPGFGHGDG